MYAARRVARLTPRRVLGIVVILWWLAGAGGAAAHGVLERSSPAANASVPNAPRRVQLWFTEPIDSTLSSARVTSASGAVVSDRPAVSADGRAISVPLRDLEVGIYTVRWRVLSTVDGHTTSGALVFGVGVSLRAAAPTGASPPDPVLVGVRWAGLAAMLTLAGAAWFQLLVVRPLRGMGDGSMLERASDATGPLVRRLAMLAVALVPLEAALRVQALIDLPLRAVWSGGHLAAFFLTTRPGWSLLARGCLAALVALPGSPRGTILRATGLLWFVVMSAVAAGFGGPAVLAGGDHLSIVVLVASVYGLISVLLTIILPQVADFRLPDLPWVTPLAAAIMLGATTLSSHAWGSGALAVLADLAHLGAAAVWVGGVVCSLVVLAGLPRPDRVAVARAMVPRFSSVAGVCVAIVAVTGLYATWLHVPAPRAFVVTSYGQALFAKILVVVALVALGAVNRFVLRPRLAGSEAAGTVARVLRTLSGEVALGGLVVMAVAVLTLVPPARLTMLPSTPPLVLAGQAGSARVRLTIEPALPGWNRFEAAVTSQDGRPLGADARVLVRFVKLDEDLAAVTLTAAPVGDGRYRVEGGDLAVPGLWQVDVVVRRRGQQDATHVFPVRLGSVDERSTEPAAAAMLAEAERAFEQVQTWKQDEQVTDGVGGLIVVDAAFARPDRLRARTQDGGVTVIVGRAHYQRFPGGTWQRTLLQRPFVAAFGYLALDVARNVGLGRADTCEGERCQVVVWESAGRTAMYAARIGTETRRVYHLLMTAPTHYMTLRVYDHGVPVGIDPP